MIAIVKYQIATYSGTVEVRIDPDDDNDTVIARAKERLRREAGTFPMGYQSFKVVERRDA